MPPNLDHLPPWRILGLDASWAHQATAVAAANDDPTRTALLRHAYRRALLQHHPDKRRAAVSSSAAAGPAVTVDQIKAAYAALGGDRAAASSTTALASSTAFAHTDAHTGLETVDLDELAFDADAQTWFRGCRCGNERGFVLGEADLEEELDAEALALLVDGEDEGEGEKKGDPHPAVGELLVECQDCSLWLCVHFAVAADWSDDEDNVDDQIKAREDDGGST